MKRRHATWSLFSSRGTLRAAVVLLVLSMGAQASAGPASGKQLQEISRPGAGNALVHRGISLRQATAIARRDVGGRVLSANERYRSGGVEYRVRLLVDGERVVTVTVDGEGRLRKKR